VLANTRGYEQDAAQVRQEAIQLAIEVYGINTTHVNGAAKYDPTMGDEGSTNRFAEVKIGPAAFTTAGWLGSSIAHEEEVHALQAEEKRFYVREPLLGSHLDFGPLQVKYGSLRVSPVGWALNELEAYNYELRHATSFGLNAAEVAALNRQITTFTNIAKSLGGGAFIAHPQAFGLGH
jgi:hypothetical protein